MEGIQRNGLPICVSTVYQKAAGLCKGEDRMNRIPRSRHGTALLHREVSPLSKPSAKIRPSMH